MMNELHLVELGEYGVVMDADHVNTLVTKQALESELDRLAMGDSEVIRRHNTNELVVTFEDYRRFIDERIASFSK